jgi:hypothetical protein
MTFANRLKRIAALEQAEPDTERGRPYLYFRGRQTRDEALAFAGLTDHEGPTFAIEVIGVKSAQRSSQVGAPA